MYLVQHCVFALLLLAPIYRYIYRGQHAIKDLYCTRECGIPNNTKEIILQLKYYVKISTEFKFGRFAVCSCI